MWYDKGTNTEDRLLFIDTETGGLNPNKHSLLSLDLVVWENMEIIDSEEILINDGKLSVTYSRPRLQTIAR